MTVQLANIDHPLLDDNAQEYLLHADVLDVPQGALLVIESTDLIAKTSLVKMLIGLTRPKNGEIKICGQDPFALSDADRRAVIGYCGTVWPLDRTVTVHDNLTARCGGGFYDDNLARHLFAGLGADYHAYAEQNFSDLDTYGQQLIRLIAAFIGNAGCIILDNLFETIDADLATVLPNVIAETCAQGKTVIVTGTEPLPNLQDALHWRIDSGRLYDTAASSDESASDGDTPAVSETPEDWLTELSPAEDLAIEPLDDRQDSADDIAPAADDRLDESPSTLLAALSGDALRTRPWRQKFLHLPADILARSKNLVTGLKHSTKESLTHLRRDKSEHRTAMLLSLEKNYTGSDTPENLPETDDSPDAPTPQSDDALLAEEESVKKEPPADSRSNVYQPLDNQTADDTPVPQPAPRYGRPEILIPAQADSAANISRFENLLTSIPHLGEALQHEFLGDTPEHNNGETVDESPPQMPPPDDADADSTVADESLALEEPIAPAQSSSGPAQN